MGLAMLDLQDFSNKRQQTVRIIWNVMLGPLGVMQLSDALYGAVPMQLEMADHVVDIGFFFDYYHRYVAVCDDFTGLF